MDNLAEKVQEIIMECLFKPEELQDGKAPENAIIVEGLLVKFGFHPERIAANKDNIKVLLDMMHDNFFESLGGGWTFLNLCIDKDQKQWGGHKDCESLLVLGIAIGRVRIVPHEMWKILPGGLPYVVFKDRNKP